MAIEVKIPQVAEGVESATVAEVLVSEGDKVEKDQSLISVESDKTSVEIPSSDSGTVEEIKVSEGDEVKVGDVILTLTETDSEEKEDEDESENNDETEKESEEKEESEKKDEESKKDTDSDEKEEEVEEEKFDKTEKEEKGKEKKKKSAESEEEKEEEAEEKTEKESEKKKQEKSDKKESDKEKNEENLPAASPGVRRLARELGVDIHKIKTENDRISKEDVKAFAKKGEESSTESTSTSLPDFSQWGETEEKKFSSIRSATAKNVSKAWKEIPHVFQFEEAEISGIQKYIDEHQEKAKDAGGKLTITAILVKICATALRQFPKFNASIDFENQKMILKKYINIGVAVDTDKGLLVPVIKNADRKSILEISTEITTLAQKARDGELKPDEMKGGNFSISNLGGIGGTNFTPIVLPPQVAILGVSRAQKRPIYKDDELEAGTILPLSLSYDHRQIDGAEGIRFLKWIAQALEDPYAALLEA